MHHRAARALSKKRHRGNVNLRRLRRGLLACVRGRRACISSSAHPVPPAAAGCRRVGDGGGPGRGFCTVYRAFAGAPQRRWCCSAVLIRRMWGDASHAGASSGVISGYRTVCIDGRRSKAASIGGAGDLAFRARSRAGAAAYILDRPRCGFVARRVVTGTRGRWGILLLDGETQRNGCTINTVLRRGHSGTGRVIAQRAWTFGYGCAGQRRSR